MHRHCSLPRRVSKAIINPAPWDYRLIVEAMEDPTFRARELALLHAVGSAHPELMHYGWGCPHAAEHGPQCKVCPGGRRGRPLGNFGPPIAPNPEADQVVAFACCRRWLALLPQTKTPGGNSYFWKHVFEAESRPLYLANGIFIAACIAAGVKQRRCEGNSPNSAVALKSPPNDFERRIWPGSRIVSIGEPSAVTFAARPHAGGINRVEGEVIPFPPPAKR